MKLRSVLSVPTSALVLFIGACDRQPEAAAKNEPAAQGEMPDGLTGEPTPQPTVPAASASPSQGEQPQGEQGGTDDWHKVVSATDTALLGRLDEAWKTALTRARRDGYAQELKALGALVVPDAGQSGRLQPAPGNYRCRTLKLGVRGDVGVGFVAYPYFACRVELTPGGDLILEKTTGSQRIRGLLYPDSERRLVYVGTQSWGDEKGFPAYGQQPERDQSGVLERIGDQRWRLVIPFPKQESQLDIIEIVR
ncbi:DUF4893 domain-containing protein [Brevundimonas sp.]|uniref:DUF4893 domain-containing protein n=1 Tax=Brevundimonas sp. TaxID=1871086 RepID=UPI002FC62FE7